MTKREALHELYTIFGYGFYNERVDEALNMAIKALEKELSVQPEIIMCKDCKHLQKWRNEESAKKFGQIYACARNVLDCPKPEDFCSFAERREQ